MSTAPLSSVRVLDLTRLLPGPLLTCWLADLGAEVVKLEDPNGGDYTRSLSPEMFAVLNRNKKSIRMDLKNPEHRDRFLAMANDYDVVIEQFRPGVMDKLGCGYEALKAVNPKLVVCAITGYGQTGPYKDLAGHDMNYCAIAGALDQIGPAGGAPVQGNFQIADIAGGSLSAGLGILSAVIRARDTGEGGFVDISMTDCAFGMQVVPLSTVRTLGQSLPRGGDMLNGGLPNYSTYECKDGLYAALGALEPKFWFNFCAAVGDPALTKLPITPGPGGAKARAQVADLFRTKTRAEWMELLKDADCCFTPVLKPEEAQQDPHLIARGMIVTDPDGKPQYPCPIKISGHENGLREAAPALGAHEAEILGS